MVDTFQLPNGVRGVVEQRAGSGTVSMQIAIKSGSANEKSDEAGLTFLTQESTNGGTTSRSRDELADEIESKGSSLLTQTTRNKTKFWSSALARDAKDVFEILADVVRHPAFEEDEIKKTQQQIVQWIAQKNQNPSNRASTKFFEAVYTGQTAANDPMGSPDVVESFTVEQVKKKHEELLSYPENIVISFAGDITTAEAQALVEKYFDDIAPAPTPQNKTFTFEGNDLREATNNEQMNIRFGFEAPSITDPKRYDYLMLDELLSGGMSSPLFVEIREKRGLVYSVSSSYSAMENNGIFYVAAGTGKGNAGELIDTTFNLLGDIVSNGFSDEEIDQARERIIRGLKTGLESLDSLSERNASLLFNHGRIIPIEELAANLAHVTNDDIRSACAALLESGAYALSGVGPQDSMPTEAEIKAKMKDVLDQASIPAPRATAKQPVAAMAVNAAAATHEIESAEPQTTVLSNGMIVVTTERPGSLSAGAWVGAGSDHETAELNGATHMNEHMMFKGTPTYGPGTIDKLIEGELGGDLNAYTSNDRTAYYFYSLMPEHLDKVIDICGEMVFEANIAEDEYDGKTVTNDDGSTQKMKGERDVVIEEIKRANDNLSQRLFYLFNDVAYPNQPHGKPILGTEDTLRAMTSKMLRDYRDEYYGPNNVVFSAAGPIKHEDFVALIEKKFGQMPQLSFSDLPTPTYKGGTEYIEMEQAQLVSFALGAEGVSNTDDDAAVYEALSEILGGGMSSRLYREVVDKRGLAAGISVFNHDFRNCGQFIIAAQLPAENLKDTLGVIYEELRNLSASLTEEELDKAKAHMEMGTLKEMETNRGACDAQGNYALQGGNAKTTAELTAEIRKITLADVKRVIGNILASNPTLSMVAPEGTDTDLLPAHDEVLEMRDGTQSGAPGAAKRAPSR